jgi:hypothetical protein
MSVTVIEQVAKKPSVDEVLRYMRAGKNPDAEVILSAERGIDAVYFASRIRACYKKCELEFLGDGKMRIGTLFVESRSLENRLSDCNSAYIFAITIGAEVDRIIRLESAKSSLSGLSADAAGSAMVEAACDEFNDRIIALCNAEGRSAKPRFSAGYGDFSIENQVEICNLLDIKKNIGVALGSGGMMTPVKSVTAIIGVY